MCVIALHNLTEILQVPEKKLGLFWGVKRSKVKVTVVSFFLDCISISGNTSNLVLAKGGWGADLWEMIVGIVWAEKR